MTRPASPEFESRPADWLTYAEAVERILASAHPVDTLLADLVTALGTATAEDVRAEVTLPPWDNSAMDGYAVRAADIRAATQTEPALLRVIGSVHAGEPTTQSVDDGTAIRIMTGAPVPGGADSVVRVEDTDREREPGALRVLSGRDAGRNIRAGGEDMSAGDVVVGTGETITPGTIAVLASAGRTRVRVHRRPTVAILPTGDELRGLDDFEDVRAGRAIPESNSPMLAAAVTSAGGTPRPLPIAPDDESILRERIESARDADILVTIGGASMGEADLVKRVLDQCGFETDFWRVKIRPGSPFSFGWLPTPTGRLPVFGLPGNPTSAFVTFELFVRPFLLALGGHRRIHRRRAKAIAAETLRGPAPLAYFLRGVESRDKHGSRVRLTGPQGSGLIRPLAGAGVLAIVPADVAEIAEGDEVEVILLDDGPAQGLATEG